MKIRPSAGWFRRTARSARTLSPGAVLLVALLAAASAGAAPRLPLPPVPSFSEVSAEAGIDFRYVWGDGEMDNLVEGTGSGCTWLDYDGDGWIDLYLPQGATTAGVSDPAPGAPPVRATNRLFRNLGQGRFADVTAQSGLGDARFSTAALAADYDNDGDADVFVSNYGTSTLYRNEGNGTFVDVGEAAGVHPAGYGMGGAWLDYDGDGDLDLYAVNYLEYDKKYRLFYAEDVFPGPLAYPMVASRLYRNDGAGHFSDVTAASPGLAGVKGRGMGALAADFDGDGRIDLFVANDASPNQLFLGRGVAPGGGWRVEEGALLAGVGFSASGDAAASMGGDLGDLNGDGLLDLVVPDDKFNGVFLQQRPGIFEDRTAAVGVAELSGQFWSWGVTLFDAENDGDLDLAFATGHGHKIHDTQESLLLVQLPDPVSGKPRFVDAARAAGRFWLSKRIARGLCRADYDNDGDVDLFFLALDQPSTLLRNDQRFGHHWLQVRLVGRRSNRDGLGATVTVQTPGRRQLLPRLGASSFASQNDPRLHFGLGRASRVDWVEVRWPSGVVQRLPRPAVDRLLVIEEPAR